MDRNVITQSSTHEVHPTEISRTSNFYVCKFTRPSSSSVCEGLVPRLGQTPKMVIHIKLWMICQCEMSTKFG